MAPLTLRTWLAGTPPPGEDAAGTAAVVIDVLRATTTAVTALAHGASSVVARTDVEEAFAARAELEGRGENPLLGGERGGFKVPGFDLGNSPREYEGGVVRGRPLVLCTSNGTAALERCRPAARLYAASFLNAEATAAAVTRHVDPVTLCCAGKEGAPALEDVCCAGRVATLLVATYDYDVDDATTLALLAWGRYGEEVAEMLRRCSHGRYLAGLGFEADLEFASRREAFPLVVARREDGRLGVEP